LTFTGLGSFSVWASCSKKFWGKFECSFSIKRTGEHGAPWWNTIDSQSLHTTQCLISYLRIIL
jgi:hypothetical protein